LNFVIGEKLLSLPPRDISIPQKAQVWALEFFALKVALASNSVGFGVVYYCEFLPACSSVS